MRAGLILALTISVTLLSSARSSRAQTAAAAKTFLINTYAHYQHGAKGIDFEGASAPLYFHSSLVALIRQDIKANGPGNAPAIDFDPICSCQDWQGIWNLKIDVTLESPKRAYANVSFSLSPPKGAPDYQLRKLVITLVPERGLWRIYDIEDNSDSSTTFALRKLLQDDIDTIRKDAAAPASH